MVSPFLEKQVIAIAEDMENLAVLEARGEAPDHMDGVRMLARIELRGITERRASVVAEVHAIFDDLLKDGKITQNTREWLTSAMESKDPGIRISSF